MRILTCAGLDTLPFRGAWEKICTLVAKRKFSAAQADTRRGMGVRGLDDRERQNCGGSAAGWRVLARAFVLALTLASLGCAMPAARPAAPVTPPEPPVHRIWVVHHGYHSGIVVRAADVAPQAWPARRDFPQAEFLEVGWGDRDYYMAPAPGLWTGVRALLWPTSAVLHVVAFDGPVERYFTELGVIELKLSASGFAALVDAVSDSHERVPAAADARATAAVPPPLGPGLYGVSRFYASRERFHLFRTCNVWIADLLAASGVPLRPRTALTANALFAQLRPHGRVLRDPP
ncbi:DUF2459 domain-containing protein [Thauera sp.]|uniref:DUF2459 domain-containing protein n=1 Tax=Thauera sp. TaxID=1905334 RepID=UPI002B523ADE|nr:DUF2459 domain-containing protein [Thauera sp.]HRP25831.1 DUF2459 domain-containing protein [Thauera sp.]